VVEQSIRNRQVVGSTPTFGSTYLWRVAQKSMMRQRLRLLGKAANREVEDFDLEGTAFFQCQCKANACPCQKNGTPNDGTCEAADFVHIRKGSYGKLRLEGLNSVIVGNLADRNTARLYATIYIDQKADVPGRDALTAMLQFLNGAYETSPLQASQVKFVPMVFSESQDRTTYILEHPGNSRRTRDSAPRRFLQTAL
jgi:hypothetical protein